MKRIRIELTEQSINNAIQEILKYRRKIPLAAEKIAQALAEKGVEIAKANIVSLDAVFTGELFNSIHSEFLGTNTISGSAFFCVVVDNEHAVFVEFGTGIVGERNPHPHPEIVGWEYASGKTIRQLADGRYGWFYPLNGQVYFTEGMPSRPFLTMTAEELETLCKQGASLIKGAWQSVMGK